MSPSGTGIAFLPGNKLTSQIIFQVKSLTNSQSLSAHSSLWALIAGMIMLSQKPGFEKPRGHSNTNISVCHWHVLVDQCSSPSPNFKMLKLTCGRIVISLFWLGWTSYPSLSPVVPMLSGILFGTGYLLIFIAMLNYLTDAYKQSSAPALAAASTTRSLAAACLPFAATPMYTSLGVHWACSLLGFLALMMTPISFVFVRYGQILQAKSPLCQKLREF